jgi:hypothetical protein
MNLQEGRGDMDWTDMAQYHLVGACGRRNENWVP